MESSDIATLLSQMLRGFQKPPRAITLHDSFTGSTRADLKSYCRLCSHDVLEAINFEFIAQLTQDAISDISSTSIDLAALSLSQDPDFTTIQRTLSSIYQHLTRCQTQREQIQHYLTVVKSAENYVKAFMRAMEQFILDEDVAPIAYQHLSERKRAFESLSVDLESHLAAFVQLRADLSGVMDSVISPRNQLLLRAESSIRLLSKFAESDHLSNFAQSRPKTRSPKEFEAEGFIIHQE